MTGIRRVLSLAGLTLAIVIGPAIPASATFADSVTVNTAVSTLPVAAPASVEVDVTWCHPVHYFDATVSWPASTTTRGVIGYRVTAYLNNGTSAVVAQTGPGTRSVSARNDRALLNYEPQVTVTTLTSYGWTAESSRTAAISC